MRARATIRRGHAHTTTELPHHEYNSNNNKGSFKSSLESANLTHKRRRTKRKAATSVCIGVRRILLYSKSFLVSATTKNNITISRQRRQQHTLLPFLLVIAFLLFAFVVRYSRGHSRNKDAQRPASLEELMQLPIVLYSNEKMLSGGLFFPLPSLPDGGDKFEQDKDDADFGGLDIEFLKEGESRTIIPDPYDMEGSVHFPILDFRTEDDVDENWMYLARDDDLNRANDMTESEEDTDADHDADHDAGSNSEDSTIKNHCRRTNFHKLHFPNCNTIHEEVFVLDNLPKMIGNGAYRQGHILERPPLVEDNPLMFKQNLMRHAISEESFEFTRMDALVSERLTVYPNIVDIYGHCGVSILSEFFEAGTLNEYIVGGRDGGMHDSELSDSKDVDPQNNLTIKEKISIALEMAESIATLHGYSGGVMTHQDIRPDQYLVKNDGTIKLNDFNRAEIMLFDEIKDKYCRYKEGPGQGDFRAPEEYNDYVLNEKVDVYSMGNNIYVLLTGLGPFYNYRNDEALREDVAEGAKPFVDVRYRTRSVEEGALIEIMERCWETNPDDRASIFEVVEFLRKLERKVNAGGKNLRKKK